MDSNSFIQALNTLIAEEKEIQQKQLVQGYRFNIFQVMGLISDEIHTHSALIAELLNPQGMHGCGDVFLRLFIENVPTLKGFDFKTNHAKTHVEYNIGEITPDYEEGGRIDILVESKNKAIAIENKIYATDQQKQMLRYYNYLQKEYSENYKLIYLTLFGKEPSVESTTNKLSQDNYLCISYVDNITKWLDECISRVEDKPLVKAILIQYNNTLNYLTHRTVMSEETTNQLTYIILNNSEYIRNLNSYSYAIEASKKALSEKFWCNLLEAMNSQYKDVSRIVKIEGERYSSIEPSTKNMKNAVAEFKLSSQRKNYCYRFGLATQYTVEAEQHLMVGIIVDSAISFRVFVINSKGGHVPVCNIAPKFKHIQEVMGDKAFPGKDWPTNFYVCAKRPEDKIDRWNFAEMNDKALENLSNMDKCIEMLLEKYNNFIAELTEILK